VTCDILTAVTMKSIFVWDVMPCRLVEVYQCVRRNVLPSSSESKSKPNNCSHLTVLVAYLAYSSTLKMETVHSSEKPSKGRCLMDDLGGGGGAGVSKKVGFCYEKQCIHY
jgi:hypothetical protein